MSHRNPGTAIERALSERARTALRRLPVHAGDSPRAADADPRSRVPDAGLVEELRRRLLGGETHYPARPGMVELRERIDSRLEAHGLPPRGPESVLITAGEGESLLVTLLGLGVFPGGALLGAAGSRHGALLEWMGVQVEEGGAGPSAGPAARYRELHAGAAGGAGADEGAPLPRICAVGPGLFLDEPLSLEAGDVVIGTLDALVDMRPFALGFVAGEPGVLKSITKWKQASSICSPGPSQRAALWALGVRE